MNKKVYITINVLLIILFIIGTFKDYEITDYLYDNWYAFSRFFEVFAGIGPSLFVVIFACYYIVIAINDKKKSKKRYFKLIIYFLLGVFLSFVAIRTTYMYILKTSPDTEFDVSGTSRTIMIVLAIALVLFITYIMNKIDIDKLSKYKYSLSTGTQFVLVLNAIVLVVKILISRPRYYHLMSSGENFMNWYQTSEFTLDSTHTSFISGHTANATSIITFLYLFITTDTSDVDSVIYSKKFNITLLIFLILSVLAGLSRKFLGYHFLTDVAAAMFITINLYMLFFGRLVKKLNIIKKE